MSEADGYRDAPGMRWDGGNDPLCDHPLGAREVTVEGIVGCANCGALLLPEEEIEARGQMEETQVRYRLDGTWGAGIVAVTGEWDDEDVALAAWRAFREHGGHGRLLKVTAEDVTPVAGL